VITGPHRNPAFRPPMEPVLHRQPDSAERLYRIGSIDLGQSQDPAAFVALQAPRYGADFIGPPENGWLVRTITEYPLGTDYGTIIQHLLGLKSLDVLIIDATGAKPFVDWIRRDASRVAWRTRIIPINIATSAMREAAIRDKGFWSVPKRELVNAMVVMEHRGDLKLDRNDPFVKKLFKQLVDFQMTISRAANRQFGAKQGSHDDLLMSLAQSCWWALRFGRRQAALWM
jgi:hypothetical protein